jgi:FkbM family methyltransferase
LEDDESRLLYSNQVERYLTGDDFVLNKLLSLSDYRKIIDFSPLTEIGQNTKVVIFGGGRRLKAFLKMSSISGLQVNIIAVLDNNKNTLGLLPEIYYKPDEFFNSNKSSDFVVLVTPEKQEHCEQIANQLKEYNIENSRIYFLNDTDYAKNIRVLEQKQYFGYDFLYHTDGEVFIDGGCYDGNSTLGFIKWCGGDYEKIYVYEPDAANFVTCEKILHNKERLNLFQQCLWDKKQSVKFSGQSSGYFSRVGEEGATEVDGISLDETLGDSRVTYIKLDVEGSELKALMGAKHIIQTQKPKLAVCLYHNRQDIWELPNYILQLNPDFRFYVRLHCYNGETVLYAV